MIGFFCSGASPTSGTPESHLKNRISNLSKLADEKKQSDLKDAGEEAKLIGKAGPAPSSSKPSDKEEGDDGDQEESSEAAAKRPKVINPDANDGDLPESESKEVATPSKPTSSGKSVSTTPLNVKPGTAEPEIVFPGK
jgi:hypothetical protein